MTQATDTFEYELDEKDPNKGMWVIVGVILLIVAAFVFLRTQPTAIASSDELAARLSDGQPKVLEFYSNY